MCREKASALKDEQRDKAQIILTEERASVKKEIKEFRIFKVLTISYKCIHINTSIFFFFFF